MIMMMVVVVMTKTIMVVVLVVMMVVVVLVVVVTMSSSIYTTYSFPLGISVDDNFGPSVPHLHAILLKQMIGY
jgi:hypothetical protein